MSDHLHRPYKSDDLLDAKTTIRHAMQVKIGQKLGALYQAPPDLPDDMLKLLMRVMAKQAERTAR